MKDGVVSAELGSGRYQWWRDEGNRRERGTLTVTAIMSTAHTMARATTRAVSGGDASKAG